MTWLYILNFSIPLAAIVGFGFMLDRMTKVDLPQEESND
jgi:hypothetical protein